MKMLFLSFLKLQLLYYIVGNSLKSCDSSSLGNIFNLNKLTQTWSELRVTKSSTVSHNYLRVLQPSHTEDQPIVQSSNHSHHHTLNIHHTKGNHSKILHQIPPFIFRTFESSFEELHPKFKEMFEQMLKENPEFTVIYFSDSARYNYIAKHYPQD